MTTQPTYSPRIRNIAQRIPDIRKVLHDHHHEAQHSIVEQEGTHERHGDGAEEDKGCDYSDGLEHLHSGMG